MSKISPNELGRLSRVAPPRWQRQAPCLAHSSGPYHDTIPHGSLKGKRHNNSHEEGSAIDVSNIVLVFFFFLNKLGTHLNADHTSPTGKLWSSESSAVAHCMTSTAWSLSVLWSINNYFTVLNWLGQNRSCSYQAISGQQISVTKPVGLVSFLVASDSHYFLAFQPWPGW